MARLLYFDCFSGISGDMVLGAMLDAGLPFEKLRDALGSLAVPGLEVGREKVLRAGVSATKFILREHDRADRRDEDHEGAHHQGHDHHHHDAPTGHAHAHRSLSEIYRLIDGSGLSSAGRERARAMFRRLGEAEAAIHQIPVEKVHLHEVGALDSIVDIVGAVCALEWARAERIVCSPLNVGSGMVHTAHGVFPVPAPATVALLGSAPIYSGSRLQELVTPTGALIATTYATGYGPIPPMTVERTGYGAGDHNPPDTPNVLRVLIGEEARRTASEPVTVLECEIDDMNPQIFGVLMERLYAAGALEVFYVPVQMKKNRPGTLLTVIAPPERRAGLTDLVFAETTTIGLRYHDVDRECLRRELVTIETPLGAVRFKLAWQGERVVNAAPEFEDCVRLAAERSMPVKEVQAVAVQAYGATRRHPS
jgi:uncharacterized protein (TIGR00299 family) protein